MSPLTNYVLITTTIGLITGGAIYDVKKERAEVEQALLQIYEKEVALKEYTRELSYRIEDLRTERNTGY